MNNSTVIYFLSAIILMGFLTWYGIRVARHLSAVRSGLESSDGMHYGIGGFLDFIIFFKSVIAPIAVVYAIASKFLAVEELPTFAPTQGWSDYKFYFIVVMVLIQLANWYVAYGLAFRFMPASARDAKILFFVTPFAPVITYFLAKNYVGTSSAINLMIEFTFSFAFSILCFSYFTLSKRIKNLYYTASLKSGNQPSRNDGIINVFENVKPVFAGASNVVDFRKPVGHFSDTKKCPYCAEEIKSDAIKCRYCLTDLPGTDR